MFQTMKRLSIFCVSVIIFFMFSCKKQVTCAAYQSYFLLDDEAQTHFFNPFGEDSLPKTSQIVNKKGGNGITAGIDPKTYKKYHYFVPMKDVISMPDDTVAFNDTEPIESDEDGISTSATQIGEGDESVDTSSFTPIEEEFFEDVNPDESDLDNEMDYAPDEVIEDDNDEGDDSEEDFEIEED